MPNDDRNQDAQSLVDALPTLGADASRAIKLAAGVALAYVMPETLELAAAALAVKPGKERWPVKTANDKDIAEVGENVVNGTSHGHGIVDTTVEELGSIRRPSDMRPPTSLFPVYQDQRAEPAEVTIWRLKADVISLKHEPDGDYHLVIQGDSGDQMIAEAPTPKPPFVKPSPWLADMKSARSAIEELVQQLPQSSLVPLDRFLVPRGVLASEPPPAVVVRLSAALGAATSPRGADADADATLAPRDADQPLPAFKTKIKPRAARITGIGFFDRVHGQTGVSESNGIELHPVLKIEWLD